MKKSEFDAAVDTMLVRFQGSLTSGRRTEQRTQMVGGFPNDPHTWGLGADVIWDTVPQDEEFLTVVKQLGLRVIREKDHDHFQPVDFPEGPVTAYGGAFR